MESLRPGTLLQGSVSAVEEHGYLVELGIASVPHVFLHEDDVVVNLPDATSSSSSSSEARLAVGTPVWCTPKQAPAPDQRTLRVSALEEQLFHDPTATSVCFSAVPAYTRVISISVCAGLAFTCTCDH